MPMLDSSQTNFVRPRYPDWRRCEVSWVRLINARPRSRLVAGPQRSRKLDPGKRPPDPSVGGAIHRRIFCDQSQPEFDDVGLRQP